MSRLTLRTDMDDLQLEDVRSDEQEHLISESKNAKNARKGRTG
jgi:hypothetical protein